MTQDAGCRAGQETLDAGENGGRQDPERPTKPWKVDRTRDRRQKTQYLRPDALYARYMNGGEDCGLFALNSPAGR